MDSAPPVSYPVARLPSLALVQALAAAAGALVLAIWWRSVQGSAAQAAGVVGLWLALGLGNAWAWWRSPQGVLIWADGLWRWSPAAARSTQGSGADAQPVSVRVRVDWQNALCLSWRAMDVQTHTISGAGAALHWVWLTRSQDPARWHALRCALFCPGQTFQAEPL